MADLDALISVRDAGRGEVDVTCQLKLSPNAVFWLTVLLGFCRGIAWVIPVLTSCAILDRPMISCSFRRCLRH